ncbi:MAG: CPBP family intramembrane metalloprotease [Firmicutes bacterium]|nr:CPBP family intramembrane metalloprotease [Bacillota bacterium]
MPVFSTFGSKKHNWRVFDIFVILFIAMIIVPNLVTWLVQIFYFSQGRELEVAELKEIVLLPAVFIQELALLWLTLASVRRGYERPLGSIGLKAAPLWGTLGAGILWGAGLLWAELMAEQLSYLTFSWFLGRETVEETLLEENSWVAGLIPPEASLLRLGALFVLLVIVVPVAEEVFYRGFAFQVFKERFGGQGAVFLTAFIFALMHGYLVHFLPIFVIGVGLGYIVKHFGSVWPGIIGHALVNLVAYVSIIMS